MSRPLAEALKDLEGWGFVHWSTCEDLDDAAFLAGVPVEDFRCWPEDGDALCLYVETGWGLNAREDGRVGELRLDLLEALRANPDWAYHGSGGISTPITEVYPFTASAWPEDFVWPKGAW